MSSIVEMANVLHSSWQEDQYQTEALSAKKSGDVCCDDHRGGICAICLNEIVIQETASIKGCEHCYCVTCILRWASYHQTHTCPQCKQPFEFLNVYRALDGRIHDYMIEESVCLLLRATWFKPLIVEDHEDGHDESEDYYPYEDEDDIEEYLGSSSSLRVGNQRWGDNGDERAGRQKARPINQLNLSNAKKKAPKDTIGRQANRTIKREAANKAAGAAGKQKG